MVFTPIYVKNLIQPPGIFITFPVWLDSPILVSIRKHEAQTNCRIDQDWNDPSRIQSFVLYGHHVALRLIPRPSSSKMVRTLLPVSILAVVDSSSSKNLSIKLNHFKIDMAVTWQWHGSDSDSDSDSEFSVEE